MAEMAPVDLPYLQLYRSNGKLFTYYRRGRRQVRVRAKPGSDEFAAAYVAAEAEWHAATAVARPSTAPPGSLDALIETYKASPEFKQLAAKTQRDYQRLLDMLATRFGRVQVTSITRAWVKRMRDEAQDKPRTANLRVAIISALLSYAVDSEMRPDNPALRLGKLETGDGHRIWTPAEIEALTSPAAGAVRLPVLIARWTSLRQADVLKLTWSAYDGQTIRVRQGKTQKTNKMMLTLPVVPELRTALEAAKKVHREEVLTICTTAEGRPWRSDHFRHQFAAIRAKLKLPKDLHFHGLRPTRLTEIAEGGGTDAELMATSGHKSRNMVSHYTAQAQQAQLAKAAVVRLKKRPVRRKKTAESA